MEGPPTPLQFQDNISFWTVRLIEVSCGDLVIGRGDGGPRKVFRCWISISGSMFEVFTSNMIWGFLGGGLGGRKQCDAFGVLILFFLGYWIGGGWGRR